MHFRHDPAPRTDQVLAANDGADDTGDDAGDGASSVAGSAADNASAADGGAAAASVATAAVPSAGEIGGAEAEAAALLTDSIFEYLRSLCSNKTIIYNNNNIHSIAWMLTMMLVHLSLTMES